MKDDGYTRSPRPVLGWALFAFGITLRVWAVPIAAAAYLIGTAVQMFSIGWLLAWDSPEFEWALKIRNGKRKPPAKRHPIPCDDDCDDDWTDYEP